MVLDHTKVVYTAEDEQGFTFRQINDEDAAVELRARRKKRNRWVLIAFVALLIGMVVSTFFNFDGKKMTVQRRCSLSDKIIWGTLLIIDLFILYLFRQSIWLGLAWFCALLLLEVLPFYALESCVTFRHVKMFVTHYLADYIGESEEIYEM